MSEDTQVIVGFYGPDGFAAETLTADDWGSDEHGELTIYNDEKRVATYRSFIFVKFAN